MPDNAAEHGLTEYEQDVLRVAGGVISDNGTATHGSVAARIVGPEVAAPSPTMVPDDNTAADRATERLAVRRALLALNAKGLIDIPNGAKPVFPLDTRVDLTAAGWEWLNANG